MIERGPSVARIEGITQRYGAAIALDGVDIEIPSGCMAGLIGPDGVGKSTLLSIMAGARQIQTGKAFVLGGDMADAAHRLAVCSHIAYMPQGLGKNLYADLTVRENVEFFGRLFGQAPAERNERIAELLDSTGLAPFADRLTKKLSGGMRQKLGLCCCLIHDPDLLILDEPTTGVDPLSRRQFWELIKRMRARVVSRTETLPVIRADRSLLSSREAIDSKVRRESERSSSNQRCASRRCLIRVARALTGIGRA